MGKSDQNKVKQQANTQLQTNNANAAGTNDELQAILGTARTNASNMLPGITAGYSDISATGGYDPKTLGRIDTAYGNLEDISKTGGFSPTDISSMYGRASDAARSTFDTAKAGAQRTASATGGFGDISAAVMGDLARKGSEAAERAVTGTTATLAPTIASNKLQATTTEGSLANTTANNIAGNRLSALAGSTNVYGLNENQINQTVSSILENYKNTGQLNNQDLSILQNLANQPGVFDKIVGTIGTLGGAAAGVLGAIAPKGLVH